MTTQPRIETGLRRIVTAIPVPESLPLLDELHRLEPLAMQGQPPVVWQRAEGFQVFDPYGNRWIDWSSGVLVANAGHGRKEVVRAITGQAASGLLTNYVFPSQIRKNLVERLSSLMPEPLKKVFLLTTGSETVECVIKLCRMHGVKVGGLSKHIFVSFIDAFHGRTLGAQQAGGIPALKEWIVGEVGGFVQVPFPDGYRTPDTSFEYFERCLADKGVDPKDVAGVMLETYQGGSAAFAPPEYMQQMRRWCDRHKILLVCDEVQAGFGRTGTLWGFEHYGIVPDLATFGKGISSSLPLSAVAGSEQIMDMPRQNTMTSTHSGNPVCCAAALASLDLILGEDLPRNSRLMGDLLLSRLHELKNRFPEIGHVHGKGLVAGVLCVRPGTKDPDAKLAADVVRRTIEKGVLMFSPVGVGGGTIKICPPLVITEEAILESTAAFEEAFAEAVAQRV